MYIILLNSIIKCDCVLLGCPFLMIVDVVDKVEAFFMTHFLISYEFFLVLGRTDVMNPMKLNLEDDVRSYILD